MLVSQIVDDKKLILEIKNLKRKSKMTILGLDDQGLKYTLNYLEITSFFKGFSLVFQLFQRD